MFPLAMIKPGLPKSYLGGKHPVCGKIREPIKQYYSQRIMPGRVNKASLMLIHLICLVALKLYNIVNFTDSTLLPIENYNVSNNLVYLPSGLGPLFTSTDSGWDTGGNRFRDKGNLLSTQEGKIGWGGGG